MDSHLNIRTPRKLLTAVPPVVVVRRGRTAKARLGMKIDPSLSDARLRVEIEGVDTNGARQVETDAGSIRIAG